ncbi:MAG: hypothetical protein GJ680_07640 [Alteromonadaceae bacterium]|nr:hypothetical protein [Alteromonadaceae bacterium]
MTKAEFYLAQQALGLSDSQIAHCLNVSKDTIKSWKKERGNPIPDGIEAELEALTVQIAMIAEAIAMDLNEQYENDPRHHPRVFIYRENDWHQAEREEALGHSLPFAALHQLAVRWAMEQCEDTEPAVFWWHTWSEA